MVRDSFMRVIAARSGAVEKFVRVCRRREAGVSSRSMVVGSALVCLIAWWWWGWCGSVADMVFATVEKLLVLMQL